MKQQTAKIKLILLILSFFVIVFGFSASVGISRADEICEHEYEEREVVATCVDRGYTEHT